MKGPPIGDKLPIEFWGLRRAVSDSIILYTRAFDKRLDSSKALKWLFAPFRGYFLIYFVVNFLFLTLPFKYAPFCFYLKFWNFVYVPLFLITKVIMFLIVKCYSPGKIKRDVKIENYISKHRKDLKNLKLPDLEITVPLRAGFCEETGELYNKYEGFSYLFMKPIAVNNAPVFFVFYFFELAYWVIYTLFFLRWIEEFFADEFTMLVFVIALMIIYFLFITEEFREIWYSAKYNITYKERANWKDYRVFTDLKGKFTNPFDGGVLKNFQEFFISSSLFCWTQK